MRFRSRIASVPGGCLMLALYRGDRQAEALEAYQEFRVMLRDELGLEPTADLRNLQSAVLRHEVEPAGAAVSDMRFELPAPMTSLIGRQNEIAELGDLLQQRGTRLVTVTGARRQRQEPSGCCARRADAGALRERGRIRRARTASRIRDWSSRRSPSSSESPNGATRIFSRRSHDGSPRASCW